MSKILTGKTIIVMGAANKNSIAWGCTQALINQGANVVLTYQNKRIERSLKRFVPEGVPLIECDVSNDENIEVAFSEIKLNYGKIDGIIHAIAFANKNSLEGNFVETTQSDYMLAQDISAYSLIAIAREARLILKPNASIVTLTYYGSERVVPNYNMMGVAKASLEAVVRYLASAMGPIGIRINAISAGAVRTLAITGICDYDKLLENSKENAVSGEAITINEIGDAAAFLLSDLSRGITGDTIYVDKGAHLT